VRDDGDGQDHDDDVDPDGKIGDPAEFLECTDLTKDHTKNSPDDAAHNIADAVVDLRQTLSVTNDNNTDVEEQLDRLKGVERVASVFAVDAESNVSVCLQREFVRVEAQEHVPDLPTGVTSEGTKDGVQDNARAVTHLW